MSDFQGWKNYETHNVALWLRSDESLYAAWRWHGEHGENYAALVRWLANHNVTQTGDGVAYASRKVCRREINLAMAQEATNASE